MTSAIQHNRETAEGQRTYIDTTWREKLSLKSNVVSTKTSLFHERLIWSGRNSRVSLRQGSQRLKQASELEGTQPDASPEVPSTCTHRAGPSSSSRAANSWSSSSCSPDITLAVHYSCKLSTQSKEHITATITDFVPREAANQIFLATALWRHPSMLLLEWSITEGLKKEIFLFFFFTANHFSDCLSIQWLRRNMFSCRYELSSWVLWTFFYW